jgi:class 3 adenylate cyclase/tetratricopeptide (TPR) repeat protein
MRCRQCGQDNSDTNSFCEACGLPLGPKCTACGHANRVGSRFCGNCSKPLNGSAQPSQSSDQLLRSLSASGGERKRLTILFADIRNSTGLIATIDPEQAMHRMQPVLDAMKDAVHRYDGIVNKVQGDGVMALFGAPRPHEDHAARACLAALAMQDAVARIGDSGVSIRVGLHTGEVVVQTVHNSLYQTYDATGATVHLANRLEQMAESGGILVTGETFRAAEQSIEAKLLGERMVRGLTAPVEIFQVIGVKHAPASERFRSGPRPSPLSGRRQELATLELELVSTMRGDARVVGVVGEAGLGKSRLGFEFAEGCRRKGIRVLEARVLPYGRDTPLQPVLELLRDAFGIQPNEPAEVSRSRISNLLEARGVFGEILPLLLDFLGLGHPAYPVPKLDPSGRKSRLLNFVRQLIHSRPQHEILLILVEDLHWLDRASEDFVEALVDAIVGTKTLLLVNFRPGFVSSWMQRSHYRQVSLTPLDHSEAGELLRELLGGDASLALLIRNIAERSQGNPFFLEELVHSLIERGDFDGEPGAYHLKGGIDSIPLPNTVQAVLSARIDSLEDSSKQVLQTAAVIGREVPIQILEIVTSLSADEVAQAVWQLRRSELLYELPPHEPGLHAFKHPLIQEVAYQSLLSDRRRKLHADVARAIEIHYKAQADERANLLAFHLEQAGEVLKAAQANMRAAVWIGANDPSQALRSWRKVRDLLNGQPSDQGTNYLRMLACGQIINYGWREGISAEEAKVYFDQAKRLALAANNVRANALIHAGYGRILAAGGSADEYVNKIREAEILAGESIDASLQVTLKAVLCHALRLSGRMMDALAINIEALERAHEIGEFDRQMLGFDVEPWLIAMRGQTLVMLGRGDEARGYLDRVLEIDAARLDAISHVIPNLAYVDLAWATGDVQLAERHAEQAFSLAIRSGSPYLRVYAQACRGLSYIVAGRFDEASKDLIDILAFARRRKAGLENEPRILADLANAYSMRGEFAAAISAATEAVNIATARHTRVAECLARIVLAKALCASANTSENGEAEQELNRAEALVNEIGVVIFMPHIQAARAKLAGAPEQFGNSANIRCVGSG